MKVIFCLLLTLAGMSSPLWAQTPLPTSGPSFTSKDTTVADVISVASLQAYPVGIERRSTRQEPTSSIDVPEKQKIDTGPIRDWSNPPGYMGSRSPALSMSKHKPLTPKKYHRPKSNRCYIF